MKEHEMELKENYFVRCHSSFLVNLRFVYKVEKYTITLKTGDEIPVSQKKKSEFMKELVEYFGKERI